jgi:hypothetical protein
LGEEPLNHNLFCGVGKTDFDNWFRENPYWKRLREPTQMVRVEDEDQIIEIECPTITNSLFSDVSLRVISVDISKNILKISVGGTKTHKFRDLIPRDAHYTSSNEYRFEIKISDNNIKDIPWENISTLDRKKALRCVVIAGGVIHSEIVEVVDHYERVRSDFTGELPPVIPPKIMKVVKT